VGALSFIYSLGRTIIANVSHANLTEPNLHEPKGASTATAGQIIMATGGGVGRWTTVPHGTIYFLNYTTPYSITYPSSYTKASPTTTASGYGRNVTEGTNAKLTYTGTYHMYGRILATLVVDQAVGANRDLYFALYQNGVIMANSESCVTAVSGNKNALSIQQIANMAQNDYFELYCKNSGASGDVRLYRVAMSITGIPDYI
jgi:hypothetical protein